MPQPPAPAAAQFLTLACADIPRVAWKAGSEVTSDGDLTWN
jgi:hypothetical protein